MLEALGLVVLGAGVGTFGTLVGAGGGFVLVPLLALVEPTLPTSSITAISLGVVAFNASSGTVAYLRQGRVDLASGLPFALAALPSSVAGALLTRAVPREFFDLVFAVLLIALATFIVVSHEDEPLDVPEGSGGGHVLRVLTDIAGTEHRYRVNLRLGIALSAAVGLASSFFGIGGGIIHVPLLVGLLGFPAHIATATSQFVLALMAATGTVTHLVVGDLSGLVGQTLVLGGGAVAGAQVGARLSSHVRGVVIVRLLAGALFFVGVRLGAQALLAL